MRLILTYYPPHDQPPVFGGVYADWLTLLALLPLGLTEGRWDVRLLLHREWSDVMIAVDVYTHE